MSIELKIPEVGESIREVQIAEWLKSEGDHVNADEPVAVIDSEKTTFELPAPREGVLAKILHQAGDTVGIGEVVAQIETDGAAEKKEAPPKSQPGKTDQAGNEVKKRAAKEGVAETRKAKPVASPPAGPSQKPSNPPADEVTPPQKDKLSDREPVPASPPEASRHDSAPSPAADSRKPSETREEEVVPMSMLRRTVARRLVEAQQTMAMLTTFNEVDMSAVQTLRSEHQEAFQKRYQVKIGLMSFFVKASIDALKQYPQLNAEIRGENVVYRNYFDIGVAIASERGLAVPVLRNAETLGFAEIEKAIGEFARQAGAGKLRPEDLSGGTFTISNGGVFGSLLSTPIINPPQSSILGMHAIVQRPIAHQGQVVIRPMMYLALTYDHRIVDGREAVLFLGRIKAAIENPARMLLEV